MVPWFQPEALPIGPFSVKPFGLFAALATVTFYFRSVYGAERFGLDKKKMENMCFWIVACSLLSAHLFELFAYRPDQVLQDPSMLWKFSTGFSSFGGFLGTFIGGWIYCRWIAGVPILPYADCIARYFPMAWALGRVGCLLVHDHPGGPSDFFLAVDFPEGPRHDLALYELLFVLSLEGLFFFLAGRARTIEGVGTRIEHTRPVGFFMALLIGLYAPVRFGLDFLRLPEGAMLAGVEVGDKRYLGLTPAQFGCLVFLAVSIYLLVRFRRRRWTEELAKV